MHRKLTAFALLAILATACGPGMDSPAGETQVQVAAMLEEPGQCPSGDSSDVESWINEADANGQAHIPAGCYKIDDTLGIPEGRRVIGAGMDETIFYRDPDAFRGQNKPMVWVFGRGDNLTRISGIAFVGVRDPDDRGEDAGITLSNVRDLRVDHCYFEGFGAAAIRIEGASRGVVDHSIFVDNYKPGIGNLGYGVVVYGTDEWAEDPAAGTAEAVFVEDNVFVGSRHAIASNAGAHYVFRHNLVQENVEACAVDAHGLGFGSARGTRYVEVYQNVIEEPEDAWCGIGIRGGDGVIFGNTIRGYRNPILLILEWGTPKSLKASYPAKDQIREMWVWDNTSGGRATEPRIDPEATGFLKEGRDYWTEPKPGYNPYEYPHPLAGGQTSPP